MVEIKSKGQSSRRNQVVLLNYLGGVNVERWNLEVNW